MVAQRPQRNAGGLINRLKGQASGVTDQLKSGARALKDQAAEQAGQLGRVIRDEANKLVNDRKVKAATKIHSVGWAAEKAARFLHAGKVDGVAEYVEMAAQSAERASKYLERNDLTEILDDVGELARENPAVVFGGMFLVGIAIGRFLKAAEPPPESKAGSRQTKPRRPPRGKRRDEDADE